MGFDIKAAVDGIAAVASQYYPFLLAGLVLLLLFGSNRVRDGIHKALTDNWQLTLLASTGIALSLASAYTTFDGLRNFTSAPLLSVFISFGVQGVMLIVAWLIGESFAVGMNQRASDGRRTRLVDASVGALLGVAFVGLTFYWVLHQYNAVNLTNTGLRADMVRFADVSVYFLFALVLFGMLAFGFRRGGDLSTPYVQSARLVIKNAVLWVMFLASMTASVFFSFDSHFNAIFPTEARKRAAEIRTTNQIGGVVADIGAQTQKRQIEEAERLFDTDGWKAYDKQLANLSQAAQGAQGEIEKYYVQQMEVRRSAIAQQQERIATAQSGQAGLAGKKVSLVEELSRLKAERPGLAAEYGQHKSELDAKAKEIDGKRVEGLAEDRGVEGTLKVGKGPVYRQRMAELNTLQDQYKIKQERTKDAQKRLVAVETRIAQIERELSTVDGDLAKLKGEAETAEQRIKNAQATNADDDGSKLDPARVLPSFERARASFRQQPDTDMNRDDKAHRFVVTWNAFLDGNRLAYLSLVLAIGVDALVFMSGLFGAQALRSPLSDVPSPKARSAHQLEAIIEAALLPDIFKNARLVLRAMHPRQPVDGFTNEVRLDELDPDSAFQVRDVLNAGATIGAVRETDTPGQYLVRSELHTFLSDVIKRELKRKPEETEKGLDLDRLEKRIREALMPHVLDTSTVVLHHLHPIDEEHGFTSEIYLDQVDPQHMRPVRNLLTAGSGLRVVQRVKRDPNHYFLHADLYQTLARIRARELAMDARARRPALWGGRLNQAAIADGRGRQSGSEERQQIADFSQAARAPAASSAEDGLRLEIWNEMLNVMGLDLVAASRIRQPNVSDQATAAWYALDQLAQGNDRLRSFLKEAEDYKVEVVAQKYSELRSKLASDQRDIDLLDEIDAEVQSILRPLLLLPEAGLIQELIDRLEEPAQHDDGQSPGEQELRDLLSAIRSEIERIDKASRSEEHTSEL